MRAIWKDKVIAESDSTVVLEGNHYFPPDALKTEFFRPSRHHTTCPWKGTASYLDVVVGEATNPEAAWYYPDPKPSAQQIRGYIAFWHGVEVQR